MRSECRIEQSLQCLDELLFTLLFFILQTFGNFQRRDHRGYGAGRGRNYWGAYSGLRGHGFGGRGRGGNMHA